ncbi:MAG: hypothetical protein EOO41_04675 [Methanobacteriota archaeon]|nr:MAG: hypothetical protein EOO41_04675 [Euryarchaeota archaeon]
MPVKERRFGAAARADAAASASGGLEREELHGVMPPSGLAMAFDVVHDVYTRHVTKLKSDGVDAPAREFNDVPGLHVPVLSATDMSRLSKSMANARALISQLRRLPMQGRLQSAYPSHRADAHRGFSEVARVGDLVPVPQLAQNLWMLVRDVRYAALLLAWAVTTSMAQQLHLPARQPGEHAHGSGASTGDKDAALHTPSAALACAYADETLHFLPHLDVFLPLLFAREVTRLMPHDSATDIAAETAHIMDASSRDLQLLYKQLQDEAAASDIRSVTSKLNAWRQKLTTLATFHQDALFLLEEVVATPLLRQALTPSQVATVQAWIVSADPLTDLLLPLPHEAHADAALRRAATELAAPGHLKSQRQWTSFLAPRI